ILEIEVADRFDLGDVGVELGVVADAREGEHADYAVSEPQGQAFFNGAVDAVLLEHDGHFAGHFLVGITLDDDVVGADLPLFGARWSVGESAYSGRWGRDTGRLGVVVDGRGLGSLRAGGGAHVG